ncbi:MAG: YidC/Oxa1 family membrane protein insertase [Candidatus Pacebacteria bacterium]|nr:YidC/Oxa1 family membrane protein insertase [Candidatus Paceibacterota bacterium]
MTYLYHLIFYEPLYNGLAFLTNILPGHDIGLAIIILTLMVRTILLPFNHSSSVTQIKMREIEPAIREIKEKFKNNKEEQARQTMALYREKEIRPFFSFFTVLIQIPVFLALFFILRNNPIFDADIFYSFVERPTEVGSLLFGFIDVSKSSYLISFLAAITQFFQVKLSMPGISVKPKSGNGNFSFKDELQKSMSMQMKYIMPVVIFFVATRFASGLPLYWTTANVFAIVHEIIISKKRAAYGGNKERENRKNKKSY